MPPRILQSTLVVFALTCSWTAAATPDFPNVVVQDLSLAGITIDPPMGCKLCHPTDSGGTSNSPFGQLLQQDGAKAYDQASLRAALTQVMTDCPQLIMDIQDGRDPNLDSCGGSVHSPEHGCVVTGEPVSAAWSLAPIAAAVVMLARRRARR